jgi:hypothetical protein
MICFVLNRFNEPDEQVQTVINRIRSVYPNSVLQLNDDRVDHLKSPKNGGAWTHRYLTSAVSSGCDHIIKVDPDTEILSAVENLPTQDCIFCRVREVQIGDRLFRIPAGGALGFTRGAAQHIVDEKYFLQDCYKDNIRFANYNDIMLMDIVWRNKLPMIDRPDFCCGRRPKCDGAAFFHK